MDDEKEFEQPSMRRTRRRKDVQHRRRATRLSCIFTRDPLQIYSYFYFVLSKRSQVLGRGEMETASRIITSKWWNSRGAGGRWNGINSGRGTRRKQRRVNKSSSRTSEINIKIQVADTNCSEFNPFLGEWRRGLINVPLERISRKKKKICLIHIYISFQFDPLASSFPSNRSLVAERGQEVTKFATTVVWSNPHRSPNVKWTPAVAPFRRCPTKHGPTPLPTPHGRISSSSVWVCTRTELDNGNNLEFLLRVSRYVTSGNVDVGQVRPQRRPEHVKNGGSAINIRSQRAHVYTSWPGKWTFMSRGNCCNVQTDASLRGRPGK